MRSLISVVFAIGATAAHADPTLYSIAPDGNGVGRVLTPVSPVGAGVALGDGSTAFNGGLAYRSSDGSLFTIANDSNGQSSLLTVERTTGTTVSVGVIGTGFSGGLAIDGTNTLYALGADFTGLSSLYSLDATTGAAAYLGTLGFGFTGLAFDSKDQSFYAFAGDLSGVQDQFERIDLTGGTATATTLFALGTNTSFNGGLAYDPGTDDFLTIGNDVFGNSTLYAFDDLTSGSLATVQSLGGGYVNAGLTLVAAGPPADGTVPEPSTPLLIAGAVLTFARRFRLPRFHRAFIPRRTS